MQATPRLTHVALPCRDIAKSIDFYRDFAGLHVVHERVDDGTSVVWLAENARDPDFVIVLIGHPDHQTVADGTAVRHLGYDVASRAAVDEIARRGQALGNLVQGAADAGPVVGYFCMLRDPDGNFVEFSHGQPVNPRELKK